jgi:hypothetical protein
MVQDQFRQKVNETSISTNMLDMVVTPVIPATKVA